MIYYDLAQELMVQTSQITTQPCDKLPKATNKKAFIFSTRALTGKDKIADDHSLLKEKLQSKGYIIIDEFQCKGFNTNSFLKFFGGMNKGKPNTEDLKNAEEFVLNLKQKLQKKKNRRKNKNQLQKPKSNNTTLNKSSKKEKTK